MYWMPSVACLFYIDCDYRTEPESMLVMFSQTHKTRTMTHVYRIWRIDMKHDKYTKDAGKYVGSEFSDC